MTTATDLPPVIATWKPAPLSPVTSVERDERLDVLRGVALFGILTVNMAAFSWPMEQLMPGHELWNSLPDKLAEWVVRFLAEGKFYPLFALLFGWGAALQMRRAESRGAKFTGYFCRRLAVLWGFGLAHGLLLWEGDILFWYALCGFPLLGFRHRKPRTLLLWSAGCIGIPAALGFAGWALLAGISLVPEAAEAIQTALAEGSTATLDEAIQVFAHGSYGEIFLARLKNLVIAWLSGLFYAPTFFGMFLLGMYAGHGQHQLEGWPSAGTLRRILLAGAAIGFPASLAQVVFLANSDLADLRFLWLLSYPINMVGGPAQSVAYAAALLLLLQSQSLQKWLSPLANAGRMALTNYLMQSVICTTIFYSYGFGLYGSVGRAAGVGLAVAIFLGQLLLSHIWLKRFRFGPMEWLWRSLTYWRRQPMRS